MSSGEQPAAAAKPKMGFALKAGPKKSALKAGGVKLGAEADNGKAGAEQDEITGIGDKGLKLVNPKQKEAPKVIPALSNNWQLHGVRQVAVGETVILLTSPLHPY